MDKRKIFDRSEMDENHGEGYIDYGDDYEDEDEDEINGEDNKHRQRKYLNSEYDEEIEDDEEGENRYDDDMLSEYDKELLEEMDELDSITDDDDEDVRPSRGGGSSRVSTIKRLGVGKANKRDMRGSAVRERFIKIMEDYHSDNQQTRTDAMEQAMKELEGFIHLIIKRSYSTYTKKHYHDLVQEGYLGVAIGMEKYNPNLSMPTTFFYPYIKHEMQGYITKNVDKTTSHYSSNIKKINKVIQEFEEKGISYTNVDIAQQTGMTIETVDQSMAIRHYRDEVHIDACPPSVIDAEVEENKHRTPEQEYIEKETIATIYRAINTVLTNEEAQVLQYHFGLAGSKAIAEGEIAKTMGIPKDKVKRLLNRAIRKLRDSELANIFEGAAKREEKFLEEGDVAFIGREASETDIAALADADDWE